MSTGRGVDATGACGAGAEPTDFSEVAPGCHISVSEEGSVSKGELGENQGRKQLMLSLERKRECVCKGT